MTPPSVDPFFAAQRRRKRRLFFVKLAVITLPMLFVAHTCAVNTSTRFAKYEAGLLDPEKRERALTEDEKKTVREQIAQERKYIEGVKQSYRKAIDAAVAQGFVARPDLGACPRSLAAPTRDPSRPSWLSVATAAEVPSSTSRETEGLERNLSYLESQLDWEFTRYGAASLLERARGLGSVKLINFDVLFVIDKEVKPRGVALDSNSSFSSGEIEGRAYLYDYRYGAVVCAAKVHAENSEEVDYKHTSTLVGVGVGSDFVKNQDAMQSALETDLWASTYRAIATALQYRAGPPQGDAAPKE